MHTRLLEFYHHRLQRQLSAIITRYKSAAAWGGNTFSSAKLYALGWRQLVSTPDAIAQIVTYFQIRDNL
jgi:hypothetical protein